MIPFLRPELPPSEEIDHYFAASRDARWFSNGGPCHELLAERAGRVLGGRPVVPVSSGSIALIAALRATAGVPGPGRAEVLLPSFTFAACAAAAIWAGFEPVFCDVDEHGWHLCPDALERAMRDRAGRVAAILACATFGTPVPADQARAWRRVADEAGVPLIVDSASGLGPDAQGDVAVADAAVFSMHATKPMPVGEGGLVALRDDRTARRVRVFLNHGLDEDHHAIEVGLNGKLDEWHAAVALAGLDRLASTLAARRSIAAGMRDALAGTGAVFQRGAERSATQFVPVAMATVTARDMALDAAARGAVEMRTYFSPPLHRSRAYRDCQRAHPLAVTDDLAARILSLPMSNDLTGAELGRIVDCVAGVVAVG